LASEYSLPQSYETLTEVNAPSPEENPHDVPAYRHRSLEDRNRKRDKHRSGGITVSQQTTGRQRSTSARHGEQEDGYTIPDTWDNLNENTVPSPVENPREGPSYRHTTLEDDRSQSRNRRLSRTGSAQHPPLPTGQQNIASLDFDHFGRGRKSAGDAEPPPIPDNRSSGNVSKEQKLGTSSSSNTDGGRPNLPKHKASRFATELYTISYLILFSILGTLARLGLQWLAFYPGAPVVTGVLWANFAGSLFMGFLSEDRQLFRDEWGNGSENDKSTSDLENGPARDAAKAAHTKIKKTIPLYIGLATGFCGSFTSFSSFMRDVFFALSNELPTPINHPYPASAGPIATSSTVSRNGGYSFMALLAVIIITITLCVSALKVGAHIAILIDRFTPTFSFVLLRKLLDRAVVVIAWGAWLGTIIMAIWPPDRPSGPDSKGGWANETWRGQAIFALVFAPVGCLLRFYASLKLNGIMPSFPLGTFAVNIFGTAVLGMAYDLQHVNLEGSTVGGGRVACQVLQGLMDGFCGCLTTVSTWVAELNGLRRKHAYYYGGASVLSGLGVLVVVMGSVRWTVGWTAAACVT
jgi:fluoride ion exporter CrcB/FEX